MSPQSRRPAHLLRRLGSQWHALVLLTAVWVLLWGDLSWANVIAGAVIASAVLTLFPLPAIDMQGTVRPWRAVVLVARFVADLFVASFEVAWKAVRPGPAPHGAIVAVRLRNPEDAYLTITAVMSSLVPGSLVVEARRSTGVVYLHVLDIDGSGGAEAVRRDTLALEERVLRAFASDAVLARCGLAPGDAAAALDAAATPPSGRGRGDA
ncbi:Na+/H+ antiporter subunit E [Isoptericola sp. NPDC056573]|uniref:Na+/H+ antiporter subunit E n=1 Tax=unclassified Isoptericola TaxID=2623355 RepID=UPI0036A9523C